MQLIHSMAKRHKFTAAQQFSMLCCKWKGKGQITRNGFTWTQQFQPTPLSEIYVLKITYQMGFYPKTFIVSPKPLPLAAGAKRLPHTYDSKKQRICLFKPEYYKWKSSKPITDTIVHWAVLWMFYYESWLHTGVWLGGGHGNWDVAPEVHERELDYEAES